MFDSKQILRFMLAGLSLTTTVAPAASYGQEAPSVREIEVIVDGGYKPAHIDVRKGERVRLRFVRKEHGPCTKEVLFPKLGIRRELPTDQPVVIELPALEPGEYEFKCGMNMIKGTIAVAG